MNPNSEVVTRVCSLVRSLENENVNLDDTQQQLLALLAQMQQLSINDDESLNHANNVLQSVTVNWDQAPEGGARRGKGWRLINIEPELIKSLLALCFTATEISKILGVSRKTIYRKLKSVNETVRSMYTNIADDELREQVTSVLNEFPNTGSKCLSGFLRDRGIKVPRSRVRETLKIVDAAGVTQRARNARVIYRRQYNVKYSNSMWHVDTYMKLTRWKIIIKGAVDGKSRCGVFLDAANNNTAASNFNSFTTAIQEYGIPLRTRSDKGGENVLIAKFMLENRGTGRSSHICGRSVHNQRIERFWRDVHTKVASSYKLLFYHLEEEGLLQVDNATHIFLLHSIFLPRINDSLQTFRRSWNWHPLSTENNRTPNQLIFLHRPPPETDIFPPQEGVDEFFRVNNFGDLDRFEEDSEIRNPRVQTCHLLPEELQRLNQIDVRKESLSFGQDIYIEALACLSSNHYNETQRY